MCVCVCVRNVMLQFSLDFYINNLMLLKMDGNLNKIKQN